MNYYSLIFCLLLVFVNLQEYELPQSILDIQEDAETCSEEEYNEDSCFGISSSLKTPNSQCCLLELITNQETSRICSLIAGTTEEAKSQSSAKSTKAFLKELYGFSVYVFEYEEDVELKHKQNYKCKDGTFSISYGYEEYSSEEIKVIKSEKHCLRYFYSYALDYDFLKKMPSEDDCFKADILQNSKDNSLKCGYYQFNIKYSNGNTKTYSTCYLLDPNILKTKEMDERSTGYFQVLAMNYAMNEGENYSGYTIDFSDSEGNSMRYDPLTNKVEISENNPSDSTSPSSNSKTKSIDMLLFLLIFLILF